jgi:hypothetical protein
MGRPSAALAVKKLLGDIPVNIEVKEQGWRTPIARIANSAKIAIT